MIRSGFLLLAERRELESVVRCPSEDHGIARRCNALLLLDDGKSCVQIAKYLYLDDDTIRIWYKKYAEGGFDLMASFDYKGGFSKLTARQEQALITWLDGRVCQNVHEVRAYILDNLQIHYSKPGCIKLLHRLGFEYTKPQPLPGHIDEAAQTGFIANYQRLLNGLTPNEAVYFCDAVHPEHQSRPAHGWMRKDANTATKRSTGRRRVNIHACVNLENFDTPFMDVDRVDSVSTMHRHVTHNKFYPTFTKFGHAILKFLRETIPKQWRNFRDTVTDNFRIISDEKFRVME